MTAPVEHDSRPPFRKSGLSQTRSLIRLPSYMSLRYPQPLEVKVQVQVPCRYSVLLSEIQSTTPYGCQHATEWLR